MKGKIKYTIINGLCVPDTKDIMDNISGGGSGEPDKYIKEVVNSQNKILTLIDNKDNVTRFEPETSGKPDYYLVSAENKNNKELKITTNTGDSIDFIPEVPKNYIESVVNTDNKTLTLTDNLGVVTKFTPTGGESPLNYLASISKDSDNQTITITDNKDNETTFPYGGSGTSDYRALDNLPTINGVKILGDKFSADYDLVSATEQHPINEKLASDIKAKQDKLTAGANITIENNVISTTNSPIQDVRYNGNSVVSANGIANLNLTSPNGTITLTVSGEQGNRQLNVDSTFAKYNTADDGLILTFSKESDTLNIKHAKFSVGSTNYDGIYLTSLLTSGSFIVPGIFKVLSLDVSNNLVSNSLTITPDYSDYQTGIVKTRIELKENTGAIRSKVDVRSVFNLESGYLAQSKSTTIDNYTCIIENNHLKWNFEAALGTSVGAVGTKLLAKSLNATFTDTENNKWKIDYSASSSTWTYRTGEILWGTGSGSNLVWLPLSTEYKYEPSATNPLLSIYAANTANTTGKTAYFRCCLDIPLIKQ